MKNNVRPNQNTGYRSLQQYVMKKMVQEGKQSQDSIIKNIVAEKGINTKPEFVNGKTKKNKKYKSVETSVFREFRNLMLGNNPQKKRLIAKVYQVQLPDNQIRNYYNLTDDGIDWYIENLGLTPFDFWSMAINLFHKDYKFKFAFVKKRDSNKIDNKKNKQRRIEYENSDVSYSYLEKWSFEKLYEVYKKRQNLSETLFNPLGSVVILELLKDVMIREPSIWTIDGKNYKKLAISVLKDYAFSRKNKIKKFIDLVYDDHNPEDQLWQTLSNNLLIYYHYPNPDSSEERISIFGVLYLIKNLTNSNEVEQIIQNNADSLPLVFDDKIWADIMKMTAIENRHNSKRFSFITDMFFAGFGKVFHNSFNRTLTKYLNKLYYSEHKIANEFEELQLIGSKIIQKTGKREYCNEDAYRDYLIWNTPLPKSLQKYEKIYSEFRELEKMVRIRYKYYGRRYSDFPDISDDVIGDIITKSIQENITFHFYSYLQDRYPNEWEEFLSRHPPVNEFWNRWCNEIDKTTMIK